MSRVPIGRLRQRLALEVAVRTGDGGGGALVAWSHVADLWAAVTPLAGGESIVAESQSGRVSHEVMIRHRAGVLPSMRFRLGARILEIAAVLDLDERRRMLRCLCREELL